MTITRDHITERVGERLQLLSEGAPLSSEDRVTIERAIDDTYEAYRDELRLGWDLDDVPVSSVLGFVLIASALAASGCQAENAASHEAKYDLGLDRLRMSNRPRPDNTVTIVTEHF